MASIKKGGERDSFVFYFLVIPPTNNIYIESIKGKGILSTLGILPYIPAFVLSYLFYNPVNKYSVSN